jgi:hypothetical protein
VLKCDVRKFFPSVDQRILLSLIARKIKDPDVLWLARLVVEHSNPQEDVPGFFPGDDLFTALERKRGIPIGNQTSQFFANVYLDPLDHFVKERLRCRHYLRYCDDFVILDNDQRRLAEVRDRVEQFLVTLRLWLHPKKRAISRVEDGLRFLGYRVWPDHRRLDRCGVVRFCRRLRTYQRLCRHGRLSPGDLTQRIRSWIGHACHADTWRLRTDIFRHTIFLGPTVSQSRASGRLVEQQSQQHPVCQPQQEHAGQPEQQYRVPCFQHCKPASD